MSASVSLVFAECTVPGPEYERDGAFGQLLERARAGDASALGELLEGFREPLRQQSLRDLRQGVGARLEASDVVQRTCLSAVKHFGDFQGDSPAEFAGWLKQVHRRNLLDEVRKHTASEKRDVAREAPGLDPNFGAMLASPQLSPSRAAIRVDENRELDAAIQRLPDAQGQAVRLKYFESLSLREIAQRLERSEEAVAGLLRRGIRKLRQELESEDRG